MLKSVLRRGRRGFTLIEIMIVILIIGVLLAIAVPNFIRARETARLKSCLSNLRQIDAAKDQYAAEHKKRDGDAVDWSDIIPTYIKTEPECPTGVPYTLGSVGQNPTCSIADHVLP
ncbi:MAG: prepilin-type N-terminal cleavage/methylation domain-containing protein [Armatimonadetes bacterium]|nr:prepilin-type N-terminal cleavage/methylation domain-containing protein [Armatimonadota bacterium]